MCKKRFFMAIALSVVVLHGCSISDAETAAEYAKSMEVDFANKGAFKLMDGIEISELSANGSTMTMVFLMDFPDSAFETEQGLLIVSEIGLVMKSTVPLEACYMPDVEKLTNLGGTIIYVYKTITGRNLLSVIINKQTCDMVANGKWEAYSSETLNNFGIKDRTTLNTSNTEET